MACAVGAMLNPLRAEEWGAVRGRVRELAGGVARIFGQAEFLLLVLELIEAVVDAALREKFLMRALLAEAALVKDENARSVLNGAQTMRDDERSASRKQAVERFANLQLGFCVDARGGFIEDKEARIMRERSREADKLALAYGERGAALVDAGVDTFGQRADKIAEANFVNGVFDSGAIDARRAETHVGFNRSGEEEGILQDDAK